MIQQGGFAMRRNHRCHLSCLWIALGLIPLAGCRMMVHQAVAEVRGAQGKVYPVSDVSAGSLARYGSVRFEPSTTETNDRITPSALLRAYDKAATEAATKDLGKVFSGGGSALTVRTVLWYFQSK